MCGRAPLQTASEDKLSDGGVWPADGRSPGHEKTPHIWLNGEVMATPVMTSRLRIRSTGCGKRRALLLFQRPFE